MYIKRKYPEFQKVFKDFALLLPEKLNQNIDELLNGLGNLGKVYGFSLIKNSQLNRKHNTGYLICYGAVKELKKKLLPVELSDNQIFCTWTGFKNAEKRDDCNEILEVLKSNLDKNYGLTFYGFVENNYPNTKEIEIAKNVIDTFCRRNSEVKLVAHKDLCSKVVVSKNKRFYMVTVNHRTILKETDAFTALLQNPVDWRGNGVSCKKIDYKVCLEYFFRYEVSYSNL